MRIAFIDYVCDPSKPGKTGLSDLVWDMAPRLVELGDEVHVIAPYTTDVYPDARVHVHRFPIPPIGYRNILGHFLIIIRAYIELRRIGSFDIVHTPEYVSGAVISSLSRNTPLVFTEPGNIFERVANGNPYDWFTTQVYKAAARITARRCAHCIATSALMRHWWSWTGVSQDRISLVPLGVDAKVFHRVPDARSRLGLPTEQPIILYAARLSPENGPEVMLRAFARVRQDLPTARLHVLGNGPLKQELEQLAASLNLGEAVVWHGWVDFCRLAEYYSAADILAFSGFSGGTPRVILQAMACGTPIVASAIGGIDDHITHDVTGLLFPPGDAVQLASQLVSLLRDEGRRQRLGRAGEIYAHANVMWEVLIQRIRDVYSTIITTRYVTRLDDTNSLPSAND